MSDSYRNPNYLNPYPNQYQNIDRMAVNIKPQIIQNPDCAIRKRRDKSRVNLYGILIGCFVAIIAVLLIWFGNVSILNLDWINITATWIIIGILIVVIIIGIGGIILTRKDYKDDCKEFPW